MSEPTAPLGQDRDADTNRVMTLAAASIVRWETLLETLASQ
jgi:hypothetical protein